LITYRTIMALIFVVGRMKIIFLCKFVKHFFF